MIPCKRPKVTIEAHEVQFAISGRTGIYHLATCHVPGCDFTYDAAVVTDAQQQATWHRQAHRAAVPRTHIFKPTTDRPGYSACCYECMWDTPAGVNTRTDVTASLDAHLASVHGLVTC